MVVNQKGLVCEIKNSYEHGKDTGWLNGDHEGEKVIVLSTFKAMENYSSRCVIKWYDKPTAEKLPNIPVQYLRPVIPDKNGTQVVILAGAQRGEDGIVRDIIGTDAIVELNRTHLIHEARVNKLCLQVPVDTA